MKHIVKPGKWCTGAFLAAAFAFFLFQASDPSWAAEKQDLTLIGFITGTSMQVRAEALGEVIRRWTPYRVTVKEGKGGLQKPLDFIRGQSQLDISLTTLDLINEVFKGAMPQMAGKLNPTTIIPTEEKLVTIMTLKELPFNSLGEALKQKFPLKIGVGTGQTALAARKIFEYYKVSFDDVKTWGGRVSVVPPVQTSQRIQNGIENTYFSWGGYPSPHLEELNAARKMKFLSITSDPKELKEIMKVLPGFYEITMPAGGYSFVTEPVVSLGFAEAFWARPDLSEKTVYAITKAIWEHRDYLDSIYDRFKVILDPPYAMKLLGLIHEQEGIPVHPGAQRYYRERQWVK
ncbi:MAG: TAXI family TRAP transporter solute-binding subunit [Desulfobacterales bacterium]|nr:TAXI family TRAP transporter solute-binding subunit [Desulfobacterales bacterium]